MKKKLVLFLALFVINFLGLNAQAQTGFLNGGSDNPAPGLFATKGGGTFAGILTFVLGLLLQFAGIIATIYLILGAYYYMTGGANEDQTKKGKKMITNAIIGLAIIILSFVILKVVENTVV